MPAKSSKKGERAASPVEELEEVDPADVAPEVDPPAAKKKKGKKATGADLGEAAPPKKKSKKAPVEEAEADDDAEEQADEDTTEIDWEAVNQWVGEFRSQNRRLPYPLELAEGTGFDDALAKKVHKKVKAKADALVNKKKGKKIRGYSNLAKEAGFANTPAENGFDMTHPLVSMADTARLATFIPCTPDAVTVNQQEFAQHMELVKTTLAQSVAREITLNVDPMFRFCMNAAAKAQIAQGGTKITPATMMQVLKPMVDQLAFPTVLSPPGLIKFSKDDASPSRNEFDKGDKGLEEWKKAVKSFNKKIKSNDRGIGAMEVDAEDANEKKLAKLDAEDSKANIALYKKVMDVIDKEKAVAKKARATRIARIADRAATATATA